MAREALEEAGAVVGDPILLAHEQIEPEDGVASDPAVQGALVSTLLRSAACRARSAHRDRRVHRGAAIRTPRRDQAPGWIQRNGALYEAALELAYEIGRFDR